MKPRDLLASLRELLRTVLRFEAPADATVSRHFRAHHELGPRDRHVLAETVYEVLRNLRLYRHLAEDGSGAEDLRLALLGWQGGEALRDAAFAPALLAWGAQVRAVDTGVLSLAVRYSLPDWLAQSLQARGDLAGDGFERLAQSLLESAPLDLRVNLPKITRDAARSALAAQGVVAVPTRLSPWGLRVEGKPALHRLALFTDGQIEVQDEGSQLLALLLAPRRGEMVADFCAGAGGKTLALGAMMRNTGRLYAFDVAQHRLDKLRPRLARSGLSNVFPVVIDHERDDRVQRLSGKLDRVLVDAPCSGTGTLRRNPDLKWRTHADAIPRLALQQGAILTAASRLLKPGGRLVYATCSMLVQENQEVVQTFLDRHPDFECLDVGQVLAQHQLALGTRGPMLELLPHRDGTDGFFAAVMQRRDGKA